jgi:hypothetical protein
LSQGRVRRAVYVWRPHLTSLEGLGDSGGLSGTGCAVSPCRSGQPATMTPIPDFCPQAMKKNREFLENSEVNCVLWEGPVCCLAVSSVLLIRKHNSKRIGTCPVLLFKTVIQKTVMWPF